MSYRVLSSVEEIISAFQRKLQNQVRQKKKVGGFGYTDINSEDIKDSIEDNLKENVSMLDYQDKVSEIYSELLALSEMDESIIIPSNWSNSWARR